MSKNKKETRSQSPKSGLFKKAIEAVSPTRVRLVRDSKSGIRPQNAPESKNSDQKRTATGRKASSVFPLKSGYVKPVMHDFQPISTPKNTVQTSEEIKVNEQLSIDPKLIEMSQLLFAEATPLEGAEYDTLTELYKSSLKSEPTIKLK
ncbi:MAG: hypothetical protein IPI60_13625 [Saprospiraceae bacterium]|nr:hypothetical protein [Saprospiraceae bacterium]